MDYIRVAIHTTGEGIEPVIGALSVLGLEQLEILEDEEGIRRHLQEMRATWDYVDPAELLSESGPCVRVYLPAEEGGLRALEELRLKMEGLRSMDIGLDLGTLRVVQETVREEDWANNWKAYYKPTKVGERLTVCPSWEEYQPGPGELVIRLDPGMAFGTGTHQTTALCLRALERHIAEGDRVLDIGCGSGILSIAACLLGAKQALAIDIDPVAVKVTGENAKMNGLTDVIRCIEGDLLSGAPAGVADVTVANIVADAILRLLPAANAHTKPGGMFIASGIIDEREDEVRAAALAQGFQPVENLADGPWRAMVFRRDG